MRLRLPWVGKPLAFLQQPVGLALAVALTTFLLTLGGSTRTSRKSGGEE